MARTKKTSDGSSCSSRGSVSKTVAKVDPKNLDPNSQEYREWRRKRDQNNIAVQKFRKNMKNELNDRLVKLIELEQNKRQLDAMINAKQKELDFLKQLYFAQSRPNYAQMPAINDQMTVGSAAPTETPMNSNLDDLLNLIN